MYGNYQTSTEPDISSAIALLSHLSMNELQQIVENDEKYETFVKDFNQSNFNQHDSERHILLASNRSLAEFNITFESRIETAKDKLRELSEKAQKLLISVNSKSNDMRNKSGCLSLDATLALLQTGAAQSEEESDDIADKYLKTEIDLDEFLQQFLEKRKMMHLRRVKAEKLAEIVNKPSPSRVAPPLPARAPYPAIPSPQYNNIAPYPSIQPNSMPPYPSAQPNSMPYPINQPTPYPTQPNMPMPYPHMPVPYYPQY